MGANPAQRVGIAATYAKRYSLLGIIGMAPEDDDDAEGGAPPPARDRHDEAPRANGPDAEAVINENQVKMLSTVATHHKWTDDRLHDLLAGFKYNSRKDIKLRDFDAIVTKLKAGPDAKQATLA